MGRLFSKRAPWLIALGGVIGYFFAQFPAWSPIIQEWFTPKFRFETMVLTPGETKDGAFYHYGKPAEGWVSEPVGLLMYARLTNNDSRAREISAYRLEFKCSEGWRRADPMDLPSQAILEFRALPAVCKEIEFIKNMNWNIRAGAIEPHRSTEGWFFFTRAGEPDKVRITIFDTVGDRTTVQSFDEDSTMISLGAGVFRPLPPSWVPPWRGGTAPPP